MGKTNALYLKIQRLIAETHRYTDTHKHTARETHTDSNTETYGHTQPERETHTTRERDTHTRTYKELLQMFTLPFASHMNLNKLFLQKHSIILSLTI